MIRATKSAVVPGAFENLRVRMWGWNSASNASRKRSRCGLRSRPRAKARTRRQRASLRRGEGSHSATSGGFFLGVEESLQVADARGMAQLAQGLGFDLADALASDVVHLADFLKSA